MDPPLRSLAPDAHGCIMVVIPSRIRRIQGCAPGSRPIAGSPLIVPSNRARRALVKTKYKQALPLTPHQPLPPDRTSLAPCSRRQGRCAPPGGGRLTASLDRACARRSRETKVGTKGWPLQSNKGMSTSPLTPKTPYKDEGDLRMALKIDLILSVGAIRDAAFGGSHGGGTHNAGSRTPPHRGRSILKDMCIDRLRRERKQARRSVRLRRA